MTNLKANRHLPSLNALRVFEAAARHLSFKQAALELNVSQSAISHQIKAMENTLGVSLFIRRPRAVELTAHGQFYYPLIRDAFDNIAEATEVMIKETSKTILTLQVYSTFTIRWLLPRLEKFQTSNPDIQIRLHTSQSNTDFHQSSVDAGILIGQSGDPTLHYEHLFDVEMFPVCSPAYLDKHGAINKPADLLGHPLLQVYPSADDWPNWLAANGLTHISSGARIQLQMESYNDALISAANGFGIALGQQPYMTEDLESGKLIELFPGQRVLNPNHWYLTCRREKAQTNKFDVFRNWLVAQVKLDSSLQLTYTND